MRLRARSDRWESGAMQAGQAQKGVPESVDQVSEAVEQRLGVVADRKEEMRRKTRLGDHTHEFVFKLGDPCAVVWGTQVLLETIENDEEAQSEFFVPRRQILRQILITRAPC